MKCEICHKGDAETAINVTRDGEEEELYVCKACAEKERVRRQKKSQRTRRITGSAPGMSVSITQISGGEDGEEPPPIVQALMHAFDGIVSDMEKTAAAAEKGKDEKKKAKKAERHALPTERAEAAYRVRGALHLEGLHLIGELEPVRRALAALKMQLRGVEADGVKESAHVYEVQYEGSADRARRIVGDMLAQERNARRRLVGDMARVFGDSICRALAILKNCRLLSPGELFDLLSPIRLAAQQKLLEGITLKEIDALMAEIDLDSSEDKMEPPERDRVDGERADEMNRRFEDVVLNARAEEVIP